ncbi:Argininosuccinate lyase [hydrothermal vent metagenome]|uniref:Argininosuccinate lyase n=1 Tax=hydrothermal vent metagenome TaxID=652676 RepID=A0A3B1DE03_9ZZZZ
MSKFWGSRFEGSSDSLADKFSFSISYDYRLAIYDVIGSIAHATMLGEQGIIPKTDANKIVSGLNKIGKQIDEEKFEFDPKEEDIHSNIQSALKKLIGKAADRLHTARSRNDLIVLDMKLYCLVELTIIINLLAKVQKAIIQFADQNQDVIIPAYTHLQSAQVVLLSHHMLAYVEMLERDKGRLFGALERLDTMPLGSCALSGTSLPIDRDFVAKELGFFATTQNSIDSVSDRDFIIEALSGLAIAGMHFSRMSEDLIIWATSEFNFIDIDWSLCTGSSIMPHKKNPDMLELIRGESAKLASNVNELLMLMKGLPLTYNRDLQLDKPPLFESVEKVKDMLGLLEKLFLTLKVNKSVVEERIHHEYFFSVDIMEYLIQKGITYREAHDTVGKMIKECVDKGKKIADLSDKELKKYSSKFESDVKKLLNPKMSVKIKKSLGSTNPKMVKKQIEKWKKVFK